MGLQLVSSSDMGLQLVSSSGMGLQLVSSSDMGLQLVSSSDMGLKLVASSVVGIQLDSSASSPCLGITVIFPLSMECGSFPSCMLVSATRNRRLPSSFQNFFYTLCVSASSPGDLPLFQFWRAVLNSVVVRSASHFSRRSWLSDGTLEKMSSLMSDLFLSVL
jgi:hypothetical protein